MYNIRNLRGTMINSDGNSNVGYTVVTRSTGLWLGFGEQRSNGFAKIATM